MRLNVKKQNMKWSSPKLMGLLGSAALVMAMGCVPEEEGEILGPQDDTSTLSQGIQNGTTDTTRTSIVGMYTFQGQFGGICSGTLIAPNLVLTAQHCIASLNSQYVDCNTSRFGQTNAPGNIYITTNTTISQNARFFGVREVVVPQGSNSVCGNDIALLILSQNVPANIATPVTPRLDEPVRRFEEFTAVGYGHTGNGSGSGVRRSIDNRVIQCGGSYVCPSWAATPEEMVSYDSNTCQGDSGGAALDSQGRLLATLSRGGADPRNQSNQCYSSVHVTVASWASWIRTTAQRAIALGQYPTPSWVGNSTLLDNDFDGLDDDVDNCAEIPNPDQKDFDNDGFGDVCDDDIDGDGINNNADNCSTIANADQIDFDNDGYGDLCDNDDDNDGILDASDNCPLVNNGRQKDFDNDGLGDLCDDDDDGDGVLDVDDECPEKVNPCTTVTDPGNGSTDPGNGGTDPGNGTTDPGNGSTDPGTGGNTDPGQGGTDPGNGGAQDEEEPFIIIVEDNDSNGTDEGTCSTTHVPSSPAKAPLTALLGFFGLVFLRRRRLEKR